MQTASDVNIYCHLLTALPDTEAIPSAQHSDEAESNLLSDFHLCFKNLFAAAS